MNGAGAIFNTDNTAYTVTGNVTLAGDATINNASASFLLFFPGAVDLGANQLTMGGGGSGASQLAGVVSGTGGITVATDSVLFLSGAAANTYTGLTTVSVGGVLNLAKTTGPAMAGNLLINGTVEDYISVNSPATTSSRLPAPAFLISVIKAPSKPSQASMAISVLSLPPSSTAAATRLLLLAPMATPLPG